MNKMSIVSMKEANGGGYYYCRKCLFSSDNRSTVIWHIATHHPTAWNIITCWLGWKKI